MANINELLDKHVTLDVECVDRLYLNGYIANLQVGGQLASFLIQQRGAKIPSPALLNQITTGFKKSVEGYASENALDIVHFERHQRKDDIAAEHRKRFTHTEGVYLIGVAQEKAKAFKGAKHTNPGSPYIGFDYSRQPACVNHYYFYLVDKDFGPAFIKICTYAPFGIKVYLNGHEWVKRQLIKEGIAFEALDNGILSCEDPERLQATCDRLGPQHINAFFSKWLSRLPLPLTRDDRAAGYDYRLSIWQMEVSRTQVFARPQYGRQFFEELIRENIDLGRPDRLSLVFDRRIVKNTPSRFRTRVIQPGVHPSLHIEYKTCHLKQYFKENRALRTETTINDPKDLGVAKDISNFASLQLLGRDINRRLLDVQRSSQNCALSSETVDSITQPTVTPDGQRAPGLRFGDPRVMALLWALTLFAHLPTGFTNATLRSHVSVLLGDDVCYRPNQMTYDIRRLSRKGIIQRLGHSRRYTLTSYGRNVVLFFTKLDARVFRPAFASFRPVDTVPRPLATAFSQVEAAINNIIDAAQFPVAA